MKISEKRELLETIEILIKRPSTADEKTISTALENFNKLIKELTDGYLSVVPVQKDQLLRVMRELNK